MRHHLLAVQGQKAARQALRGLGERLRTGSSPAPRPLRLGWTDRHVGHGDLLTQLKPALPRSPWVLQPPPRGGKRGAIGPHSQAPLTVPQQLCVARSWPCGLAPSPPPLGRGVRPSAIPISPMRWFQTISSYQRKARTRFGAGAGAASGVPLAGGCPLRARQPGLNLPKGGIQRGGGGGGTRPGARAGREEGGG